MKVFSEEQKFTQPLLIIGLTISFIVVTASIINSWKKIAQESLGIKIGALSGLIIVILVALLFLFLKLKTRIDEKGVYYQFYPIHTSLKIIPWSIIENCYVRNYDAISEFGGWGMKFSFRKKGKSFTTKGNIGLQLELKNGKKILIGTQQKESVQKTIETYESKFKTVKNV